MKFIKAIVGSVIGLAAFSVSGQDPAYEEWYLNTTDSLEIYVRETRNSKPQDTVIVVHGGFGANHDYMLDAVKGLEASFHFVFYDQRGSLLSPAPVEKLTFDRNVEDLHKLIRELNGKNIKLLCHSMGTLVGMELVRRYPGLVSNVVMVSAIIPKSTKYDDVFSERVNQTAAGLIKRLAYLRLIEPYERKAVLTDKERTERWRIEFAAYNCYHVDRWRIVKGGKIYYNKEAAVMGKADIWNFDYRDVLQSHSKVTYIQGTEDLLDMQAQEIGKLLNGYPGITLKRVEKAGHLVWIDKPAQFRQLLKEALQER